MASTIGTAYINIAPNMSGIQGKIAGGLKGSGSQFADQFGGEITGKSAVIIGALAGIAQAGVTKAMSLVTNSIGDAVKRVDTLNAAQKTFQYMGFSAADSAASVKTLTKNIQGLPTSLDGAISGMSMLAATYGDVKLGQKVFTALNDGILGMGGSAASVTNAVQQLSQLPLDGPLDAQTWNSLRNSGLTPVMVAMGKDMGKSVSQLKADFGSGKLTVQDFTNELTKMDTVGGGGLTDLHTIAMNATSGIGTGFANMQTAITRGLANIIQAIGQKNISDAIAQIGKAFEVVLDAVAKSVPQIVGYIKNVIDFVVRWKDLLEPVAVGILAIAAALLVMKAVNTIATVSSDLSNVVSVARLGADALKQYETSTKLASAAQAVFNAIMDANPISIIILAIVALVAGLVFFFTQTTLGKKVWSEFMGFLVGVWENIKIAFAAVGNFFAGVWKGITNGLAAVGAFFSSVFKAIMVPVSAFLNFFKEHWRIIIAIVLGPLGLLIDFVTAYWSQITGAISTALNAIWSVITGVFNAIAGFFSAIWSVYVGIITAEITFIWNVITGVFNAIAGFMGAVFGPPINAIIGVFQWLGGIIGGIVGGIWNGITSAFNAVTGFLGGIGKTIINLFLGAGSWLYDTGKNIIDGLINGAKSLLSKIGEMFLNIIPGWIKDPFKKALGINSPSRVFMGFGDNITTGLVNGIAGNATDVTKAVGTLADNAVAGMAGTNLSAQFGSTVNSPAPAAQAQVANNPSTQQVNNGPAVAQTNNIYNQVDLNTVTRELAWQIRR